MASHVTLEVVMVQLQSMDAHLDTLNDELCQVNTCLSRIAWRQAHFCGFIESPSPSPEASKDEDDDGDSDDDDDDRDEDASSSSDMRWLLELLTPCHSLQKGGVVLGWE